MSGNSPVPFAIEKLLSGLIKLVLRPLALSHPLLLLLILGHGHLGIKW